jgi:hypothetical protein
MDEGEVEMGTPQVPPPETPDTEPFDDATALAYMGVDMGTPQVAPVIGTGTQPLVNETPMDYAYSKEKGDYKYAYIKGKLHMIKESYLENLRIDKKIDLIEIIFNMIKTDPERYKTVIELAMDREFDTDDGYLEYVTSESFKTGDSTDEYQTLQGIVGYPMFIHRFFYALPGAGETDVSSNERINSEIDEDREIIDLNPDTSVARSLFGGGKRHHKKNTKKRSKKKKRKSKSKRSKKRSKRKSFKRYRRK